MSQIDDSGRGVRRPDDDPGGVGEQRPASPPPPPYVPPYAGPAYVQPVYVPGPPTSGLAVASMVLGIVGAVGGWCLFGIPCLIAVLLGHAALPETRPGGKSGRGMAVAGLVLGYVFIAPWAIISVMSLLGAIASPFFPSDSPTP